MEPNPAGSSRLDSLSECLETRSRLEGELSRRIDREKKLLHRLYFHEKTGLPNHACLRKDLATLMTGREESRSRLAVVFIELDNTFDMLKCARKSVLSEWVLYRTAVSLRSLLSATGTVYQTKNNEFAVISERIEEMAACADLLGRIYRTCREVHRFPGQTIQIGCSIGGAVAPDHGTSPGDLLRNADIALSFSRNLGARPLVYEPSMSLEIAERVSMQEGILRALEEQADEELEAQFRLEYQPLVRMVDANGRGMRTRLIGTECLLRWHHPERGLIAPSRFIPLAEENRLIIPIGNWVFYRAAEQIGRWRKNGHSNLFLSVNLSPVQFSDANLVANVKRLLERQQLPADAIHLEITETAVMEHPEEALAKIAVLSSVGVRISIDDFGTGYSSLSYLRNLKVNTLKIDKSFVDTIVENPADQGIVRAIISMARSLGIEVLAEGIERLDQARTLDHLGCRNFQGYYFSRPLTEARFDEYLAHA